MRRSRDLPLLLILRELLLICGMWELSNAATIRLADNTTRARGRVEVFLNGEWGTVCDDGWDLENARVACRELGFPGVIETASGGTFGSGTGPIHLDDVMCNGDEGSLESCSHAGIGVHNCTHDEDVGVVCYPKVRLVDGLSNDEGRVEVYRDGAWGTICDDDWSPSDATVICRELGFSRAIDALSSAAFGGGCGLEILLSNLTCVGDEETVFDCEHGNLGNQTCGSHKDVGVRCDPCDNSICMNGGTCRTTAGRIVCNCPQGFTGPTCEFAGMRLIGGETLYQGRLEVFINGEWGTVCDDFWGPDDAQVACRQLGFPGAIGATQGGSFGGGTGPIHFDDVICTGDEDRLESCSHAGIGNHNCTHSNDAGIVCSPSVRLMDGSSINEGRVEVYWAGVWGTICHDYWSLNDAKVVCRELGFSRAIRAVRSTVFGPSEGLEILLDDMRCDGKEDTVFECKHGGIGNHDCEYGEDAGVQCEPCDIKPCMNGGNCTSSYSGFTCNCPEGFSGRFCESADLRLVNGNTHFEGRLEIHTHGEWGTICDDSWGREEAQVACRQLGFPDAINATKGGRFGNGTGPIHFYNVTCTGNETNLESCQHAEIEIHHCTHNDDAGVVCLPAARLANGSGPFEGRVEVFAGGIWGTICRIGWDLEDASVVCRQLGFGKVVRAYSWSNFGQDHGLKSVIYRLACLGEEKKVFDCPFHDSAVYSCGDYAGVRCANIRLVNGRVRNEGRLEVFLSDEWGTVCDDSWDLTDAQVACRQLGFPGAIYTTPGGYFGSGTGPIHSDDVICTGHENRQENCPDAGSAVHNCTHDHDVGIVCSPSVRLVNGSSSNEGRVEVYWNGAWGTVCDDTWDLRDANVICRELGFPRALQALSEAAFGPGEGLEILLDGVYCSGDEKTLFECRQPRSGSLNCDHDEDAGAQCEKLRLAGGSTAKEGRLEIFVNGEWGTVCDDSWGLEEAKVACRQLGFPDAIMATSDGYFGSGSGPIHLDNVMCTGQENDLESCQRAGVGVHDCTHDQDAGVVCAVPVRLVDGLYPSEGRVELFMNGAWGPVCGIRWDLNDATVICRELGFVGVLQAVSGAVIGPGSDVAPIRLYCSGEEKTVFDCRLRPHSFCGVHAEVKCEPGCVVTPDPYGLLLIVSAQQNVYSPGDSLEYACPDGYRLRGSARRFCQSNSTWSGQPAKCVQDPCARRPCLNNGNCTSEAIGFSCQCLPGYDGPTCGNAAHCVYEPDPSGVLIVTSGQRDVYLPGDTIEYSCTDGYLLSGSNKQICQSNFAWYGQPAECTGDARVAPAGFIVGGVVGGIILVLLLILVVVIIIRRKKTFKFKDDLAEILDHPKDAPSDAVYMESTQ